MYVLTDFSIFFNKLLGIEHYYANVCFCNLFEFLSVYFLKKFNFGSYVIFLS